MRKVRVGRKTKKAFSWHTQRTASSRALQTGGRVRQYHRHGLRVVRPREGSLTGVANRLPYPSLTNHNLSGMQRAVCAMICTSHVQLSSLQAGADPREQSSTNRDAGRRHMQIPQTELQLGWGLPTYEPETDPGGDMGSWLTPMINLLRCSAEPNCIA